MHLEDRDAPEAEAGEEDRDHDLLTTRLVDLTSILVEDLTTRILQLNMCMIYK